FYTLKYFIDHAPLNVSDKISFILGTLPKRNAELTIPNKGKVSLSDIPTWVEKTNSGDYKIYLLAQPMQKLFLDDPDKVYLFLYQLLFNAIGEIAVMKHIAGVEIIKKPRREESIRLSELANYLKSEGIELDQDPTSLLTNTTVYELEPSEKEKTVLHMDIKRGESQCYELPRDYFDKEEGNIDKLQAAGATAGFIIYHLDSFKGPNREQDIEDFHKEFVKAIVEGAGKDTVKIIGHAKGEKAGYIDLIAWDLMPIMETASEFLAKENKVRAGFHVFRRQGDVMGLCRGELAENKPKVGNPNESQ
ncbi:MAG: hypothetical protein LUC43_09565, partial [Burkholderiales bacterium]|nr:hypothetical protein [Burkholderiales bacterium]